MTPARWAATLAVLLTVVTGCSREEIPPPNAEAAPSPVDTGTPAASPSGAGTSDPLRFDEAGTDAGAGRGGCVELDGRLLSYQLIGVDRPVTIEAVDLPRAVGIQVGAPSLAPRPEDADAMTGEVRGAQPPQEALDATNWSAATPLADTQLTVGDWYLFVPIEAKSPARIRTWELTWFDDLSSGASRWKHPQEFRRSCPRG